MSVCVLVSEIVCSVLACGILQSREATFIFSANCTALRPSYSVCPAAFCHGLTSFLSAFAVMEEDRRCLSCSLISSRKRIVVCAACRGVYHLSCVGLTRAQASVIVHWSCPACLGRAEGVGTRGGIADVNLTEYISQCCANGRALRIIPRGAVITVADALQKLLTAAMGDNTVLAWGKLLSFGWCGVGQPLIASEGGSAGPSLTTRVKRQVRDFLELDGLVAPERRDRRGGSGDGDLNLRRRVAGKFADGDIRGAVRLLASSEGIAPHDEATLGLLERKHPPAPSDLSLPGPPGVDGPTPTLASEEDVRKALASFRPGSAGGPDGLRPGHLSALVSRKTGEAGVRLLASLTEFVNFVLRGEVPDFAKPIFYGATLCALGKKDGGIRPIAVGNTLRRLAAKVGADPMSAGIGEYLRPAQLGFSTRGGCEAAAHAARRYLGRSTGRRVFFKVDMANAFNSLRRDVFLRAAHEKARGLYRMLWQAYSEPSTLFFGGRTLVSATGIQQGDPFGPALFSLGIDSIVREIDSEFNVWYLDDGSIGDTPERVLSCVRELIDNFRAVGLEINRGKCEMVILNHSREEELQTKEMFGGLLPDLKVIPLSESNLLGAPLFEEGVSAVISERREALEKMTARLSMIEAHQAFVLLKNCFALPKLQYILRASPAYRNEEDLEMFDGVLVAALSSITNVHFEGSSLEQAVLPVRVGGLGIRLSKDIALPAFVSSLHSVRGLVEAVLLNVRLAEDDCLRVAEEVWQNRNVGAVLAGDADRGRQRTWDGPQFEAAAARLLDGADQISRARLLAAACGESGSWLHALPTPSLGTLLDPDSFRVAVALRVGAVVCEPHPCRCGQMMDARGLHGLSCKYSAGRHPRHAALNDVVRRSLQSAGIPSILEPVGVDRGDGRRPDGITVFPFANGRCLCWDATCVDTYAESHRNNSAVTAGSAACAAEDAKRRKYASLVPRFRFEPVAIETAGTYGGSTGRLVLEIGRRISEVSGDRRETYWLKQRIGLAVQRGNALSILASVRGRFDAGRLWPAD